MVKIDDVSINVDINAGKLVGEKTSKEITQVPRLCYVYPFDICDHEV